MKSGLLILILCAMSQLLSLRLHAYPNYITYGYQSCMSCHYNPHGNGPLTDYGRAVSSTKIASQYFLGENVDQEELANRSGFFEREYKQSWFRPAINYRGLFLSRNLGSSRQDNDWINMQANVSLVGKFLKRDKLIVALEVGYAPKPRSRQGDEDIKEYRSREHYIGYRFNRNWGVYVGLMDKVFGLRIPDHIAYSRAITGLNQNDQTHGMVLHYSSPSVEFGIQPFVGNLVQDQELRQKGFTSMLELPAGDKGRWGASFLRSASEYVDTAMYSSHGRFGFGEASSVQLELGEVNRSQKKSNRKDKSRYLFTQTHLGVTHGFWGLLSLEGLQADTNNDSYNLRLGPGLQYFPYPKLELRSDVYWTKRLIHDAPNTDSWDFTAQVHFWL